MCSTEAFVTLATTDAYALGALVLAQSIRQVGTTRNLVVLISNNLSQLIKKSLETSFDEVIVVEELNSNDVEHLELLSRPELGITFTKINCWLLEQYTKCVFLDSDCLVLKEIDQLFEREQFSAAPDAGWPDCFNSGVFVFQPSKQTFQQLVAFASQQSSSFDGGDQGLLNSFFSDWRTADISRHLPFTYNVTANAFYSYLPAVTRFRNDIHIVHFAGALKPWQLTFNPQNEQLSGNLNGQNEIQRDFLVSWWKTMQSKVWPKMQLVNQQLNSNNQSTNEQNSNDNSLFGSFNSQYVNDYGNMQLGSASHRRAWESGNIDYFGRDSFSNIEQQLQKNIQLNSFQYHPAHSITNQQATIQLKSALKQPSTIENKQILTETNRETVIIQTTASSQLPTTHQTSFSSSSSSSQSSALPQQTTKIPPSTITTVKQTVSQLNPSNSNLKTSNGSNENQIPLITEQQPNWTVKSTIVTTYTQGSGDQTGPTLVNKVVSQANASSTSSSSSSVKQISNSTHSNVVNKPLGAGSTVRTVPTTTTTTSTTANNGTRKNK